ncbi:MAG: isocitrate lyase/PEP mutase family protein [Betaproteobacteria bacterium]|nr:MAG: isocitrate lyase/PEP mutase family protein [Betaproteobacteria bacterium]
MQRATTRLRTLVKAGKFLELPAVHDPLSAKLAESVGFKTIYNGGFVTGGSTTISEPLLTMNEQITVAGNMANAVNIPVIMDAGAGWGEPLHTMRTVRECIRAGIAGVHIEDQLFPKRAHYHTYVAHNIPVNEFRDKIRLACEQRDQSDRDFVIIARSDACREQGFKEAVKRMNLARDQGADMGLIFPRTPDETRKAPKVCKLPMVYVQSRGNRDGRPLYSFQQLEDMGYAGSIDAILSVGVQFHFMRKALLELRKTGDYTGISQKDYVTARKQIEDLIGLEEYYKIERETVEKLERGTKGKRR